VPPEYNREVQLLISCDGNETVFDIIGLSPLNITTLLEAGNGLFSGPPELQLLNPRLLLAPLVAAESAFSITDLAQLSPSAFQGLCVCP
jgi:hypothetical protein